MWILEAISETIILFGRQNIAVTGKRDNVKYDQVSEINTGNFKAPLQYAPRNVTYISKTSQNEVTSIKGKLIQRNNIKDCNTASGFFSIYAGELRDIGNHEQLAVAIRFLDKENQVRKEFLKFIDINEDTTGETLS